MKKPRLRQLAAVLLVLTLGTGTGMTMLRAADKEKEDIGNSGGGYELTDQSPEEQDTAVVEDKTEMVTESTQATEAVQKEVAAEEAPESVERIPERNKTSAKNPSKKKTPAREKTENGQTLLDISREDILITAGGARGGGLAEDEAELNPKGYWITGTTTQYNIIVDRGVKTALTLDHVDITADSVKKDCLNVSHADVEITLIRKNTLLTNAGGDSSNAGNAITKDGMDGSLTIQCEYADEEGHRCDDGCGSLTAKGNNSVTHAGAIGNTVRTMAIQGEAGFANFTIKGGNIEASAGGHTPGIGSACTSETAGGGYAKNIRISGGNVKAVGTAYGSGIGSGYGDKVDGVYITGGRVEAYGGAYAPGIGASLKGSGNYPGQTQETRNIKISGGDTTVIAVGNASTNMPGIGAAMGSNKVFNVTAVPDFGYQGYIQDGISMTDYTFIEGTPFHEETAINVGKFYTMVYFGEFRDTNGMENQTKEQIGANHIISKTGGEGFTKEQLKGLTKVTGKQENGTDFPFDDLTFAQEEQIDAINEAKRAGKSGEFPLTFTTPKGTQTTVTVYLKREGSDAAVIDPGNLKPTIGANDFQTETGGDPFTDEEIRKIAAVQGKDEKGITYEQYKFDVDGEQLSVLNKAKTEGRTGTFPLSFTSPDGTSVTINVNLYGAYDETETGSDGKGLLRGYNIISKTGGIPFSENQLKVLSRVNAADKDGNPIDAAEILMPNESQMKVINQAKISDNTGDFPLTFSTEDGLQITVTVYLRKDGTDGNLITEEEGVPSVGANHAVHSTGGNSFSEEELIKLCQAKGKDANGDNAKLSLDQEQLRLLNRAKTRGMTGMFHMTFSVAEQIRAEVIVTLTGEHTVSFDPAGGNVQPADQKVQGGGQAEEPEQPQRAGYTFLGWYIVNEQGEEVKWDFHTPVCQDLKLKAKWKPLPKTEQISHTEQNRATTEKQAQPSDSQKEKGKWKYKELSAKKRSRRAAKTGEQKNDFWIFASMAGIAGIGICLRVRRKH